MTREVTLALGPPGTGKTTYALDRVERGLESGIPPHRIAFVSFTKKAAEEAVDRAVDRFKMQRADFPHFRTLHSMAYRQAGLKPERVMDKTDWQHVGKEMGLDLSCAWNSRTEHIDKLGGTLADQLLQIHALARARQRSIEDEYQAGRWADVPLWGVQRFANHLRDYKRRHEKLDFTDFLEHRGEPLDIDLLVVDESQDLTAQQWGYIRHMGRNARQVLISGDDDQSIFLHSGADPYQMAKFKGTRIVLPVSYRLPVPVHALANRVIEGVSRRIPKVWASNGKEGTVEHMPYLDDVDLSQGKWMVLSRHRRGLNAVEQICRQRGYVYEREKEWSNQDPAVRAARAYETLRSGGTVALSDARLVAGWVIDMPRPLQGENLSWGDLQWVGPSRAKVPWFDALTRMGLEDMAYIRSLRAGGESLTAPGRIVLSTIHGAKGGEADNVLLLTSINKRVRETMEYDPDSEQRVLYVGLTRARQRLVIVGDDPRLKGF